MMSEVNNLGVALDNIKQRAIAQINDLQELVKAIDNFQNTYNIDDYIVYLKNKNNCSYKAIAEALGISYTTIYKRAKRLEELGLIKVDKEGN